MKGSLRKRGDVWYYRINLGMIGGKRKEIERAVGASKKDALKAMRAAMAELDQGGQYFEPSDMAFADYLDQWLEDYVSLNLKGNTIANYKRIVKNHIDPNLGKYKLKNLSPAIIQRFIDDKKRDGYSKSSVNIMFIVLNKSLSYAVQPYAYLKINPAQNVRMPRWVEHRKEVVAFSEAQIIEIFNKYSVSHPFYIPIKLAYYTGMRIGECLALQWSDIDMEKCVMHIHNTLYDRDKNNIHLQPAKTEKSTRDIDFSNKLLLILKHQRKKQTENKLRLGQFYEKSDFVCTHENGRIITANNMRFFNIWCKEAFGKDSGLSFHSLRHTHATLLLENRVEPKYISERLGHVSVKITLDTYSHVTQKMKDTTSEIIESNFI